MHPEFASGFFVGTGAAKNISIGWVPDYVEVIHLEDGDNAWKVHLQEIMPFSGGGTTEIQAGDIIEGATSGARATVKQVLLDTGTWAAGDAAGWLVLQDRNSTDFGSENVFVASDSTTGSDDATVTVQVTYGVDLAGGIAADNSAVTRYNGSSTFGSEAAAGFTCDSTVSESSKLIGWTAWRNPGN